MPSPGCLISVIDDDESMLEALGGLLRLLGFEVETYCSGEEFMRSGTRSFAELHPDGHSYARNQRARSQALAR